MFKGKGLKAVAFKLWVNRVQLAPPHLDALPPALLGGQEAEQARHVSLAVALQVAFESKTLKPVFRFIGTLKPRFHFIGSRVETRHF
jgi:hypothetical protein